MKGTFDVAPGVRVRTSSTRQFIVVVGRTVAVPERKIVAVRDGEPVWEETGYMRPAYGPEIVRRSDSRQVAIAEALKRRGGAGGYCVVVDTHTGESTAC